MGAAAPEGLADPVRPVELGGDADIVEDTHRAEEADILERAGHAAFRQNVRLEAGGWLSGESDLAIAGLIDAGNHVEDRRFPRSVRADEADQLTLGNPQAHLADGGQPAEADRHVVEFQQGHAHDFMGFLLRSKLKRP